MTRARLVVTGAPSPSILLATAGLVLAGAGAGCRVHMCDDEISPSGRYQATIVEAYDAQTTFAGNPPTSTMETCAASDGLGAGMTLEVQATGTVMTSGCKVVAADITGPPAPVSLLGPPATQPGRTRVSSGGAGFMIAGASVTTPVGDGDLVLDFLFGGASGGIFATPVSGALPPVVLQRTFFPAQDPSPRCLDQFVVHLVKE